MTLLLARVPRATAAMLLALVATGCFDPSDPTAATADLGQGSSSTGPDPTADPSITTISGSAASGSSTTATGTASTRGSSGTASGGDTENDTDGTSDTGEPLPLECDDGLAAPGEVCFGDATVLEAGDVGYSPRVGDVGGDASVDLVYLYTDQIVVRLGDGAGGFGPELSDETVMCSQIELADVNGDGNLDVLGTGTYDDFLTVALGSGTGTFTLQSPAITLGENPVQIVAGDLNGDNHADVVTIHGSDLGGNGGARPAISDGAGSFTVTDLLTTFSRPGRDVTMGDFTGDGILDVGYTLGDGDDRVLIAINNGAAEFGQPLVVDVDALDATGIAAGDLNDDGDGDLAVGNGNEVLVLLGTGTASFMPAISLPAAGHATFVAIDDVTNDGVGDIIAIYDDTLVVSVFPSQVDGTTGERVDLSISALPNSLATGDVNDDGIPDLITGSLEELVTILLSTP